MRRKKKRRHWWLAQRTALDFTKHYKTSLEASTTDCQMLMLMLVLVQPACLPVSQSASQRWPALARESPAPLNSHGAAGGLGVAASAARRVPLTVLRMSMAMVMGPTPPGTGVMSEATSLQLSNSTSPTSL